jgi:fucose 4-O-acetylase-like acetyltransferase
MSFQNFSYDFKYAQYGIPFLTFYSSSIIVLMIKNISCLIKKQKVSSYLFTKLGESSMVIMYLHLPLKDLFNRLELSNSINLVLSLVISYLLYKLFTLNYIIRALLIGSKNDFIDLKTNIKFLFKKKYD